jgi:PhoPQ-activated pathogenicity-related protein
MENITRYLDNPYFQMIADIIDPYCMDPLYKHIEYTFDNLAYFDRYKNVKLLQFQAADDQFFPPDSEVICSEYND